MELQVVENAVNPGEDTVSVERNSGKMVEWQSGDQQCALQDREVLAKSPKGFHFQ